MIGIHARTPKNKFVALTAEWLPWLQTNWRDSGYQKFAFGIRD